ncbi:WD repeat-containing protein [Verticillium alfalfae VaMs.102]|uniref:Mitochondrial division protein 1 n=1 Tax=Verticillium alfalfae (strain VaMs.102 / ATCC MYA-4576 / FGSC 10136) TaxID=526221 RepID=C9SQW9_VERA1|nr:WD repeat-containing protein [Verticillium alfalfae VaMs.102]EEY21244.1 WD repeat-containing protein [Verticillium alfalfae VaMs.102]
MKFLWAVLLTTLCVAASLAHCIYTKLKKARRRSEDARPNGLYVISNPKNAKFVHFLKEDFPEARILLHAHNSDWMINAPIKTARQIGEQLIAELTEHLSKHLALCAHGERSSDIIDNTHAIVFLGTPHLGSPLSVIGATVTAMTSVLGSSNTLLLMLGQRNDQLLDLERRFNSLIKLKDARRGKTELLALREAKPLTLGWLSFGLLFVKENLPCVPGAAFDDAENGAEACLAGTRIELLGDIRVWLRDPEYEPLCWLHGKAGTGKSTIAQSVARELAAAGFLAASFFFKRGEGDRGNARRFFPTIAAQLVSSFPAAAAQMRHTIEANPDIATKSLGEQFRMLVLKPLENVSVASPMTVVIDALDECGGENDVKDLITQLSHIKKITSIPLNFFITSRNEPPIREGFKSIQSTVDELNLEEVSDPSIEQDIERFLLFRLEGIRSLAQLSPSWPQGKEFDLLFKMSVPLFIYAATACRFIEDKRIPGGPEGRLRRWTEHIGGSRLHYTYRPILKQLIDGLDEPDKEDIVNQFHEIVGTIIILAEPLDAISLECLLSKPRHYFDGLLDYLHSVLDIPLSRVQRIKLFHLSFRDYLVDPKRGALEFHVDEKEAQGRVARHCLRLLSNGQSLRQDICSLSHPGTQRRYVPQTKIDECLPLAVQYACLHWADHFIHSEDLIDDQHAVYSFLCTHLLHWLEALSLLKRLDRGASQLLKLQVRTTHRQKHILSSTSKMDERVFGALDGTIVVMDPVTWHCLQVLEGHQGIVWQCALAPNGAFITCSHDKTIKIWDLPSGTCLKTLLGHKDAVVSIAIAANDFVASRSSDGTVKVWHTTTGECLWTCPISAAKDADIALASDNGKIRLAVVDTEGHIRVFDPATKSCLQTLNEVPRIIETMAFVLTSRLELLVATYSPGTLVILDLNTGARVNEQGQWCIAIRPKALPDGKPCQQVLLVPMGRRHATLEFLTRPSSVDTDMSSNNLKNWTDGAMEVVDGIPSIDNIRRCCALSNDGRWLSAAGSETYSVRMYDMQLGTLLPSLLKLNPRSNVQADHEINDTQKAAALELGYEANNDKHERTISVCLSADATLVAEMSSDLTIRIWDHDTRHVQQTLDCEEESCRTSDLMVFSPNKLLLALAYEEKLKIWDIPTAKYIANFEIPRHVYSRRSGFCFSNDNEIMAWTCRGAPPVILKWREGKNFLPFKLQSNNYKSLPYGKGKLVFSKDNNLLITADNRGRAVIWDISKMTFLGIIYRNDNVLSTAGLSSQEAFKDLTTTNGTIKIDLASLRSIIDIPSLGYSNNWIQRDNVAILWILFEYRPPDSNRAVAINSLKGLIYIGAESDRVWSLQLSLPELDQLVEKYSWYSKQNNNSASIISSESDASGDR